MRIASLPLALIADNISLTQTAQKAQNLQVASPLLALIADTFSHAEYAKYADFCGLLRSRWPQGCYNHSVRKKNSLSSV